jgi:SagB-type dehydrogenase family enzyme
MNVRSIPLDDAIARRRSCRSFEDRSVPREAVEALIWAAQGRTGEDGDRAVPSAHAVRPLRLQVAARRIEGLEPGLYRADPDAGTLERTVKGDVGSRLQVAAIDDQPWIAAAAGVLAVSADLGVMERAFAGQAVFGDRAWRYTCIEAGAAAQNVHLEALAQGLGAVLVGGIRDDATAAVLGLTVPLAPVLLVCFGWPAHGLDARSDR